MENNSLDIEISIPLIIKDSLIEDLIDVITNTVGEWASNNTIGFDPIVETARSYRDDWEDLDNCLEG